MSEYMDNQLEYEAHVERLIIIIYSIYSICLSYVASQKGWAWVFLTFIVGVAICWSLFLTKSKTFSFRARVTVCIMQAEMIVFSIKSEDLMAILPIAISLVILTGLYEIPRLIHICIICYIALVIYHVVFCGEIHMSTMEETIRIGLRLFTPLLAGYATYYLVYNQKMGRKRQLEAIEELKEAERSRDDFLANVSHELRTPINTICGMSEMALREDLSEEVRQEVFNIQTSGRNLLSVVSDILDFSELQSGGTEIVEEAYNITSTINDILNMTLARRNDKKIELVIDCDGTLPSSLVGDEQKLRRVIMNLIDNAIKYTERGCIVIKIGYRKEAYGINLTVSVKDTGIGMTDANIEKIFTGFGQVNTRRNRKESGIGLGLAISSAIIEAMGGFISVRSKYAKGTEISFSVPQKVLDDKPIASVVDREKIHVATYFDMEQYPMPEVRDAYNNIIVHMADQLDVDCNLCRNLAELKRRTMRMTFSHVFISLEEYQEEPAFFDELAKKVKVIMVIEQFNDHLVKNPEIIRLYKPFFILPIAMILNDKTIIPGASRNAYHHEFFIAPGAHILIVDDNLMNIKVAEGLLKPYQVKVTRAMSGKEALEKVMDRCYDFIFMDHMMPEMDGVETLEHIRQIPDSYCKSVPIIALTANAIGGMREMFLASGFADFVAKPIEISVLERVLKRNLSKDKLIYISEEEAAAIGQTAKTSTEREKKNQDITNNDKKAEIVETKMQDDTGDASGCEMTTQEKESGKNTQQNQTGDLVIGDLDIAQGEIYCGGRENYLEVLSMQAEDHGTMESIIRYYEQEDWKNYTILVHAVKSTMKSIGAQALSDMAKDLEFAGKQNDIESIRQNHEAMIQEFRRVQKMICDYCADDSIAEKTPETVSTLPVMEEAEFEQIIIEFEDAMYTFDASKMNEYLEYLEKYQFCGKELKMELSSVRKKVDMSDYMSALDALLQVKERLKK